MKNLIAKNIVEYHWNRVAKLQDIVTIERRLYWDN